LTKNCRNTSPIVLQTYLFTSADLDAEGAGPGPEVSINFYNSKDQAAGLIEEILHDLKKQQVSAGDITILSPLPWQESSVRGVKSSILSRIKVLKGSIQDTFPDDRTTFSTISDFKGLENRFIILTDIEDLDSTSAAVSNLYVGMTRARVKLWLNLHDSLRKRQQEITARNIQYLTERARYAR
jgi:superfamily I DNA and RNA helicase